VINRKSLVSIIIPCYNQLKFTKMCIESILKYTHYPFELIIIDNGSFELIIIDNGSADGTGKWLTTVLRIKDKGLSRIKIILNDRNLGAPKAFNQGIKVSMGEYFLFLNNDTIVTEEWLQ